MTRIGLISDTHGLVRPDVHDALAAVDHLTLTGVEMRFFGGLTVDETAAVLGVSPDTVLRDWRLAKAWLQTELKAPRRDA